MAWRSNCLIEARREYRLLERLWRAGGMRHGDEPYRVKRPSRFAPRWIQHHMVGRWKECEHCGGGVHVESFTPIAGEDTPWWRAWKHLLFLGEWTRGDRV